ncbi:MAG TPA: hypothetical protein IAA24_04585 [Candidatus Eubacterium faecigallinarum]|nr:hypothetical protein [Candidatus Eubacterium faecigallinarum]
MNFEKDFKDAFDRVHADKDLISDTKANIAKKAAYSEKKYFSPVKRTAMALAGIMVFILAGGGYVSYASPVSSVSIDINPSVELRMNVYDRVVGVTGYNDDGEELAESLDVKNMYCTDAINEILQSEEVTAAQQDDGTVEVTVSSRMSNRSEELRQTICNGTPVNTQNVYCMYNQEDIEAAKEAGISTGKYRAYLELKEINPDITVDDVRNMSIREIRNMINSDDANSNTTNATGNGNGNGNGNSSGDGNGYGNGSGNGNGNGNGHGKNASE